MQRPSGRSCSRNSREYGEQERGGIGEEVGTGARGLPSDCKCDGRPWRVSGRGGAGCDLHFERVSAAAHGKLSEMLLVRRLTRCLSIIVFANDW